MKSILTPLIEIVECCTKRFTAYDNMQIKMFACVFRAGNILICVLS